MPPYQYVPSPKIKQLISSIWFWWISLTITYTFLSSTLLSSPSLKSTSSFILSGLINFFVLFIGLFVPFGPRNLILFILSPLAWISVILFILVMIRVNKRLNRSNLSLVKKIFLILLTLLILTMITDMFTGLPFESWNSMFNGRIQYR